MEILQALDIRVAGEGAQLAISEVQRGLFPMSGSTVRLPRQIPWTVAMDMLLVGDPISGRRAYEVGLVGHVVPDGETLARARELADRDRGERTARGAQHQGVGARRRDVARARRLQA